MRWLKCFGCEGLISGEARVIACGVSWGPYVQRVWFEEIGIGSVGSIVY